MVYRGPYTVRLLSVDSIVIVSIGLYRSVSSIGPRLGVSSYYARYSLALVLIGLRGVIRIGVQLSLLLR